MAGQTNRWNYRSTYRRSAFSSAHAHRKKTHLILKERIKTSATAAAAVRAKGRRTNTFSYLICINRNCFFVPFLTRNWFLMPSLAHLYWLSMQFTDSALFLLTCILSSVSCAVAHQSNMVNYCYCPFLWFISLQTQSTQLHLCAHKTRAKDQYTRL